MNQIALLLLLVSHHKMMRTTAPPMAISIVPESAAGRCEGADGTTGGAGAAITTGANKGAASLISGRRACGAAFR